MEKADAIDIGNSKLIEDITGWKMNEFMTLLDNIEKLIPKKDVIKYLSRAEKIDWNKVAFDDHTAEECKEKWKIVEKRLRNFRVLSEMIQDARKWVNEPWSNYNSSRKKNRHPDMPKKPLSSFTLFFMEKKEKYQKQYPNSEMSAIMKIIGEKFKKLSAEKKAKYNRKAGLLRDEYQEKMKIFLDEHPLEAAIMEQEKKCKAGKNIKLSDGPVKPPKPFKMFLDNKIKQHECDEGFSLSEFVQDMRSLWKVMPLKRKVAWLKWAREAEMKYLEELKEHMAQNPDFSAPAVKSVLSRGEKEILDRMEGKPIKPPNSAYSLFSRLMLSNEDFKARFTTSKERMGEVAKMWQNVSQEEKDAYNTKAKQLMDNYNVQYTAYLDSLPEDKRQLELEMTVGRKRKKVEKSQNGKKLKQTKLDKRFSSKKRAKTEESDEEDLSSSEQEEKRINEIKKRLLQKQPTAPPADAFAVFNEIYMTNPAYKEGGAIKLWKVMPKYEKEKYRSKLESQKQRYLLQLKEFLMTLNPEEVQIFSSMRAKETARKSDESGTSESSSSEETEEDSSEEEEEDIDEKVTRKADIAESSEESDD